jgi:hypothetical protein
VKLPARQKTGRPSSQNTKKTKVPTAANAVPTIPSATTATTANAEVSSADEFETFIIQIKPHHNGEVFLSKLAVNENPAFFGYPFTGSTIPKKTGKNKSYPQRDPDPTINLIAYGSGGQQLITLSNYRLNTVYYSVKSEIRITCSPIVGVVPEYSIMIMNKPLLPYAVDYEVVIHTPESPEYQSWVGKCTNKMPGGGKAPRAYGWL